MILVAVVTTGHMGVTHPLLALVRIPNELCHQVCIASEYNAHMQIHHTWFYSQFVYCFRACKCLHL